MANSKPETDLLAPPELVLGFSQADDLVDVLVQSHQRVQRIAGAPLTLVLTGRGAVMTVTRPTFGSDFCGGVFEATVLEHEVSGLQMLAKSQAGIDCTFEGTRCRLTIETDPDDQGLFRKLLSRVSEEVELPETWRVRGERFADEPLSPGHLFRAMREMSASDVHLFPGSSPVLRVNGRLEEYSELPRASNVQIMDLVQSLAPENAWQKFVEDGQCSFRFQQPGQGYSRVAAFRKGGAPHCTIRFLSEEIPSFEELKLPIESMRELASLREGLVLITGMTGSGKSTTVAAIIDWINANRNVHVLTIEDPIEYVHLNQQAVVSQREVGLDVDSFTSAIRSGLRHDPDVIFVGEMRDSDTIRSVISAAATGHLVISTVHSSTASEVVNRIVSFFAPAERDLVRLQLHDCLKCVVCQRLLPAISGGRLPALEFMYNDSKKLSDSILESDSIGMRIGMQQTHSESTIFEEALLKLIKERKISEEVASEFAPNRETLEQMKIGTYRPPSLESFRS